MGDRLPQTTVNGDQNAMPLARLMRQIEMQPANTLPELLAAIVRRCVHANVFKGRAVADIVATIEDRTRAGGPPT